MVEQNSTPRKNRFLSCFLTLLISAGILAAAAVALYFVLFQNPCRLPVRFAIGNIDSRFKISQSETQTIAEQAAERWNASAKENILIYDPAAEVKVNFVYDERQEKLDRYTSQSGSLDSSGNAIHSLRLKLERNADQYEKELNAYNQEIAHWNSQGGAPEDVFKRLNQEKNRLDAARDAVNASANLLNQQINQYNSNLEQFNNEIAADQNKIITEGTYTPSSKIIHIYTYGNKDELRLLLMHEFGHALTLGHDNLPTSIMYPILGKQDLKNPIPTEEDLQMFNYSCKSTQGSIDNFIKNLKNLGRQID